ncbi:hypothetical protein HY375_01170 [Candidatus Berkelbacteria bacterium]|nr:hypothetical protein [Candidatus Berkelbacteria bacterium]
MVPSRRSSSHPVQVRQSVVVGLALIGLVLVALALWPGNPWLTSEANPQQETTQSTGRGTNATPSATPNAAAADRLPTTATSAACGDQVIDPTKPINENLSCVYKKSVSLMFLLAFLVVIYAGYLYITSFGSPDKVNEAKEWLLGAVLGTLLLLLIPFILDALNASGSPSSTQTSPASSSEAPPPADAQAKPRVTPAPAESNALPPSRGTGAGAANQE